MTLKPGPVPTAGQAGAWNADLSPGGTGGQAGRWRILKVTGTYSANGAGGWAIVDDSAHTIWQADGTGRVPEDFAGMEGLQVPRYDSAATPGTFTVTLAAVAANVGKLSVLFFLEQ